jgi:tetratricopeptide (TPR) repeat protein
VRKFGRLLTLSIEEIQELSVKRRGISISLLAALPAVIAFTVYATTTCRSIWIGDSAEFALAIESFGIAHPPGYPLFVLLGRLAVIAGFFLRPIFAAGLFNVAVAASVASIVHLILRKRHSASVALPMSLVFAFSPVLWAETAGVEIYALNLLLISLVILALQSNSKMKWPLAAYLFGLSLTVHPTVLALLPVMVYNYFSDKEYLRCRRLPILAALMAVGGSPYFYLLIRSHQNPISDWGNPETITALLDHMTLKQYSGWVQSSSENVIHSAHLFYATIIESWSWIGLLAVLVGTVTGIVVSLRATISAVLLLTGVILLAASHQALDYQPFYLPAMFGAFLLAANCLLPLARFKLSAISRMSAAVAAVTVLALLTANYREQDKSEYTLAERYGRLLLDEASPGILFTAGDINSFPALYLRYAETYRADVEVFDRSIRFSALIDTASVVSGLKPINYFDARNELLQHATGKKSLSKIHYISEPDWLQVDTPLSSCGLLYIAGGKDSCGFSESDFADLDDRGDPLSRQLLANVDLAFGEEALLKTPPDSAQTRSAFERAIARFNNEHQAMPLNEIGIFFRKTGFGELALIAYDLALKKSLLSKTQRENVEFNISNVFKDKGNASHSRGDLHKAVQNYKSALLYDTRNPKLLLNIGLIYAREIGNADSARLYLGRYLGLNPSDSTVAGLFRSIGP